MESVSNLLKTLGKRTHIDLFAGCGGLSLGFHYAGWHGVFAVEKDPMAFETLSKNLLNTGSSYQHFNDWPVWVPKKNMTIEDLTENPEVRDKLESVRGKISLIVGGPPCQGFSVGGARNGEDSRNVLAFKMLDLVSVIQPPFVVIENVEVMAREFKSRPSLVEGSMVSALVRRLDDMGYQSGYQLARAKDFCVPQDRRRIFIIGIKKELAGVFGKTSLFETDLGEIFGTYLNRAASLQRDELGFAKQEFISIYEAIHDLAGNRLVPCPDSPKFMSAKYETAKTRYAKMMRRGIKDGEIPNSHRFSIHGQKVLALYHAAHAAGKKGRLSKEFLLENDTRTDKKVLLDPDGLSSTLTTHPDESIHYLYPRNISLREMARIQSFPDDFHFFGRYTLNGPRRKLDVARCAQIGNAVPPLLGRGLALALDLLTKKITEAIQDTKNKRGRIRCYNLTIFRAITFKISIPNPRAVRPV